MFLVIRVRKGPEVIKQWYGAKVAAESWTFADLFDHFSSGDLDKTAPLKDTDKYTLNVNVGQKKTEFTQLSPDVSIGEAVSCLGNFVDFSLLEKENETEIPDSNTQENAPADAFKILISAANLSNHLPQKKALMNNKSRLINDIISWLEAQKVGFLSTNVDSLGNQLVNVIADLMWYISGNHDTLADRACPVPEALSHMNNYYDPIKRKRKKVDKDNLKEADLRNHSTALLLLCEKSFFQREMWKAVKEV